MSYGRAATVLGLIVWTAAAGACGGPDALVEGDIAFVDVDVVPMDRERVLEDQTVVIQDGRIAAIGSTDTIGPAPGVEVVEAAGHYLMPGLTDMYAQLPDTRMPERDIANHLFLFVANGVTTVRSMRGDPSQFDLRERIDRGLVIGPSLVLASPAVGGAAALTTATDAEQRVRAARVAGFDLIMVTEGLTVEVFEAVMQTAADVGMPVAGSVSDQVGLERAVGTGQASIDRLDNYLHALVRDDPQRPDPPGIAGLGALIDAMDESRIPELVQATVEAGAWVVPAMVALEAEYFGDSSAAILTVERPGVDYMPPETVVRWQRAVDDRLAEADMDATRRAAELGRRVLAALHQGGAAIALGTDAPQAFSVPGFSVHREMALYVDIGMTPYEVLAAATRRPAEHFNATGEFGLVAVGRRADLLLLTANPLDGVGHVERRAGVMLRGRWYPEGEIQRRLEGIAQFYGN